MTAQASHDDIAASLYLQAVFPAFAELSNVCERAKTLTNGWNGSVRFVAPGMCSPAVVFQEGTGSTRDEGFNASISLFFLSSRQVVKQFTGRGFSLPLPRWGFWRIASLIRFVQLGKILEQELELHPRLLIGVALGSIGPLVAGDPHAAHAMGGAPDGLAEFGVPTTGLFAWVEWKDRKVTWGRGRAPRAPDVKIYFRDEKIALAGLRNELDEFAAIGKGDLTLSGLVPLADALGAVMARADLYLERRT